ncbi:hypothetical protein PDO_1186 [Rhizobium sp. PDO1-076]|uniref:hypothetical protein n=1 Tax=Rhizobium sp. PDO1-076 TaxID=1125979 RepID=UPI00024E3E26|nr:hypothetical protein [Rhizobium sp. PDO1-076]EHS53223.1 hypothetical protein PDO_1186 [Rhizobium sp. PDO1-076]
MSEFRFSFPACVIAGTQKLSANDILLPPIPMVPDCVLTSDEVTALMPNSPSDDPRWSAFLDHLLPCRMEPPPPGPDNRGIRWLKVQDSVFLDESHAA